MSQGPAVLVVDDDPFTRSVLGPALTTCGWMVALCGSASEAMDEIERRTIDAALLDLDLGPGPDGLDLAVALRRHLPMLPIVILTTYQSPQLLDIGHQSLPIGVRYLVKGAVETLDHLDDELRVAMRHPFDATVPVRPGVPTTTGKRLSDRQIELMRLIAEGRANVEIAEALGSSEVAIEKAIGRLIRQLGLRGASPPNKRVLIANAYFQLSRSAGRIDARTRPR